MNKHFEARLSMYQSSNNYLGEQLAEVPAILLARPILADQKLELQQIIDDIVAQEILTEASTLGTTANKEAAKQSVIAQAVNIANMTYSYAITEGLEVLRANTFPWIKKTAWEFVKDELIGNQATIILGYVTGFGIEADLVDYGWVEPEVGPPVVTGTKVDMESAINLYQSLVFTPEEEIEDRKAANIIMAELFEMGTEKLKQIDATVYALQFSAVNALYEFWVGWKAQRTIIGPSVMHTKIKGLVTAAITELPIQGAKVTAVAAGGPLPWPEPIEVFTDADGNYTIYTPKFKNVPYTVIVEKTGYEEQQETDVFVQLGKQTVKDYQLEPVTP